MSKEDQQVSIKRGQVFSGGGSCCGRKKYPMIFRLENGNVEITDNHGHDCVEFDPKTFDDFEELGRSLQLEDRVVAIIPKAISQLFPEWSD